MAESEQSPQEELLEAQRRIVELELGNKTVLTGSQFLVILLVGPLFLAFVALGTIIIWKVTSKPAELAPHLESILLVLSIFSLPVSSAAASIVALMHDEIRSKLGKKD